MSYLHRFGLDDVFHNQLKTHPQFKVTLYSGSAYINDRRNENVGNGVIDLYETINGAFPFAVKDGATTVLNTTNQSTFNSSDYGQVFNGSYPLSASVDREMIQKLSDRKRMAALQNTINYYQYQNKHFNFTTYFTGSDVNLVSIPSMMFGSSIKKGSVKLNYYFTGSLMATAEDSKRNGELIETKGPNVGSTVGVVLYNEGFMLLTASYHISSVNTDCYSGSTAAQFAPNWVNFAAFSTGTFHPSSSISEINFEGTHTIPTVTMFAHAPEGQLNASMNPTFYTDGQQVDSLNLSGSAFIEPDKVNIKNTMQSAFCSSSALMEKQVFISKIGIYDQDKNLIGIAKLANPVRKEESQGYTFKFTLDI
jgi:hypothetical protein